MYIWKSTRWKFEKAANMISCGIIFIWMTKCSAHWWYWCHLAYFVSYLFVQCSCLNDILFIIQCFCIKTLMMKYVGFYLIITAEWGSTCSKLNQYNIQQNWYSTNSANQKLQLNHLNVKHYMMLLIQFNSRLFITKKRWSHIKDNTYK